MPLLALFDVDGTLFVTHDELSGQATVGSLEEIFGVSLPDNPVARVNHAGQTSKRIAREILRMAGLEDGAIDEGLDRWCCRFAASYVELLAVADTNRWEVRPGTPEALERLTEAGLHLALLTGNPEPVARARMERLGLAGFFPEGQGAFGCESEERTDLLALARRRAGDWPAEETVAVGDTPVDVASAHEAGLRAVLIRSSRTGSQTPADADAVVGDMESLAETLLAWG